MATRGRARVDLARFGEILNAYGAHSRRWPRAEKAAALALVASSPHAAAMRDEAARLDRLLNRVKVPAASAALVGAVLSDFDTGARLTPRRVYHRIRAYWPTAAVWRPAIALTLATLLGVGVGAGIGGLVPFTSGPLGDLSIGAYGELEE
jgi:hypothetical protein